MRYFLDTEFIEDGITIDLISIALVAEDGRELYRCNYEARLENANDWVREHVIPQLPLPGELEDGKLIWAVRDEIAQAIVRFVARDPEPMFWGYYADYDWVALCQLFGCMIDLPAHFPKFCMDLKQLSVSLGSPRHPKQTGQAHDALEDARYNRDLYNWLTRPSKDMP